MLVRDEAAMLKVLACPCCGGQLQFAAGPVTDLSCSDSNCGMGGKSFPRVNGVSALVDFASSVIRRDSLLASDAASLIERPSGWRRKLWGIGFKPNPIAPRIAVELLRDTKKLCQERKRRPLVVIVGGGTVDHGARLLIDDSQVDVIAFDVYASMNVSMIADAHAIPLVSESADAVWIQAVLEHVVDPEKVVSEVYRVLRPNGVVFADSPFLWPVHEGAYDFVRWTASGHRWLFRRFRVLYTGASSGPGTVAYLAIKRLAAGLLRSVTAGHLITLPFFWLHWLDALVAPRHRLDSAGGTSLYCRKADKQLSVADLIQYYEEQLEIEGRTAFDATSDQAR